MSTWGWAASTFTDIAKPITGLVGAHFPGDITAQARLHISINENTATLAPQTLAGTNATCAKTGID